MANKKSLQQGGVPEVRNNLEYLLSELQDKIQNQNIPVQQSVADLVSEGNNPHEIAQALLQIGYKEADIKQIFSALPTAEENSEIDKQAQPQQEEVDQAQVQKQKIQQMQQEGATAKKGTQVRSSMNNMPKAQRGKSFKDWMGSINQSEMYQAPEARYLPMKKSSSSFDALTGLVSNIGDFIDTTKTWDDNKEDFYKYKVNYGEGADPSDYATNAKELFRSASKKKGLRTKDELRELSKKESRMYYDPQKGYSFDIADPYSTEAQRHKLRQKEMGVGYKKRSIPISDFQGFDYDQSQAISDYLYNKQSGNLPSGTTLGMDEQGLPIYVSGQSTNYPIMFGQKKFNTTKQNVDAAMNNLYNRQGATLDWVKKQLGGNTHNTYHGYQMGGEPLSKQQWYLQNPEVKLKTASEIDALYQEYVNNFEDPELQPEIEGPEISAQQPKTNVQQPTASFKNKGWGDFQRGMSKFGDVSEFAVNAGRNINTFLENAEYNKTLGDIEYGQGADSIYGIENPNKGYWTYQQEGILQPNMQTEYMSQRGREMKKYQSGTEKYQANELGIFDVRSDWFNSLSLDKQRQVVDHNKQILMNTGTSIPTRTGTTTQFTRGASPSRVEVFRTNKPTSSSALNTPSSNASNIDFKKWYDTNMKTKDIISPFGGRKYSQEEISNIDRYQTKGEKKPIVYTEDWDKFKSNQDSSALFGLTQEQMRMYPMVGNQTRGIKGNYTESDALNKALSSDPLKSMGNYINFDQFKKAKNTYGISQTDIDFAKKIQEAGVTPGFYGGVDPLSDFIAPTGEWKGKDPLTGEETWNPSYPEPKVQMIYGKKPIPKKKKLQPEYRLSDYLQTKGMDNSKESRKNLAETFGIEDYDFSEDKNTELLEKIKGFHNQPMIRAQIGVESELDPRYKSYQDSMNLYNAMLMQDQLMGSNKDGRYFDIPDMDWSTDRLKKRREQKYSTILKKYISPDWQNQQEMEAEISDSKYGPKQEDIDLINYYKQLGFTDDNIMYNVSPDLATDKIKAVGTYWDGKAFSPKFKKPEQEVIPTNTLYGYMKVHGMDTSFDSRKKMADMYGIKNYEGTEEQNNQLREFIKNTQEGPRAKQGYEMYREGGGFTNPFEEKSKRQLRRKKGGQVANISTEVLKKLQAKGVKFNIL